MPTDGPLFDKSGSDQLVVELLAESLWLTDCGGNGRDFCCSYHEGFADGVETALSDSTGVSRHA